MTLTVASGALFKILYCSFTQARRPLRPGASFGAVIPPAFTVPPTMVSSARLSQPRTILISWTSAPSTARRTCLTSFFQRPPLVLISALGSVALIVCEAISNHLSAFAVPALANRMADAAIAPNVVILFIIIFFILLLLSTTLRAAQSRRYGTLVVTLTTG